MNQLRKKEQLASKLTEIENTNLNAHATDPADFDAKLSDLVKIVKVIEKHNEETGNSIHLNLLYKSKLASLENISKRRDQHEESFKAQYYKKLKDLENICDSISDLSKLMDQRENEVLESRKEIERLGKQLKQRTAAISNNNSINESSGFMLTELVNTHHHTRQERNSDAPTSRVVTEVR
jgi:ATP-dependent Lon protease